MRAHKLGGSVFGSLPAAVRRGGRGKARGSGSVTRRAHVQDTDSQPFQPSATTSRLPKRHLQGSSRGRAGIWHFARRRQGRISSVNAENHPNCVMELATSSEITLIITESLIFNFILRRAVVNPPLCS